MINDVFFSFYLARMYCCDTDTTPQNGPQRNRSVIACDDVFFFPHTSRKSTRKFHGGIDDSQS
jgi:hypothetical protein